MSDYEYDEPFGAYFREEWEQRVERFADPGGNSALYAASEDNPRDLPCPTCHYPNQLTQLDVARGYQCDSCADAAERGIDHRYYQDAVGQGIEESWLEEDG